nr:DUF1350 family protein [Romeria gracilis]
MSLQGLESHRPDLLRFRALTASWAAIHPQPKGVIFFIGGAFFGNFPTFFYRHLLQSLFDQGFTLVAFPFRFSFRHWSVAIGMACDKAKIRQELLESARQMSYDYSLYESDPNSTAFNYLWLGHSLGCKYIALLELLTDIEKQSFRTGLNDCMGKLQAERLANLLSEEDLKNVSLLNQPSILLDPVVSDLDEAIPIRSLRNLFSKVLRVQPSKQQTYCLIHNSRLFGLTAIVDFESSLAQTTVSALQQLLASQAAHFQSLSIGHHLAALGFKGGRADIVNAVLHRLEEFQTRTANRHQSARPESADTQVGRRTGARTAAPN